MSPTLLTAPGRKQNCCFSAYLTSKTAFYSFSGSKQALIKRLSEPSTWLETLKFPYSPLSISFQITFDFLSFRFRFPYVSLFEVTFYSVPNRVDGSWKGAKLLFLDISRAQNGVLFVLRIETGTHKATFRTVNMVGDTIISLPFTRRTRSNPGHSYNRSPPPEDRAARDRRGFRRPPPRCPGYRRGCAGNIRDGERKGSCGCR